MVDSHKIDGLVEAVKKIDIGRVRPTAKARGGVKKPWTKHNLKTGLVFDDTMTLHDCLWIGADENPNRYKCIKDAFIRQNLLEHCQLLEPQVATEDQVLLIHDKHYHDLIKSTQGEKDVEKLKRISEKFDGIYINEFTYDNAMLALGCSLEITDATLDGRIKNGFALVRPPGHHAQKAEANGYCFFNNAAIVAKHCIKNRGLKRILIVDWDIHHGQGTQSFFYDDPGVMYISIHRYENGKFWPELIESNFNFTGLKDAKGFNLNFPLNETKCNDADYLLMWFNVVLPVAYELSPELVIISSGYDAAIGCPEGQMRLKPVTYHILCHHLMALADGKVVALLEGGYNLLSLAEGAAWTLKALLGHPCARIDDRLIEFQYHMSVLKTILSVIWAVRPQWKMLQLQGSYDRFNPDLVSSPGGDVDQRFRFAPVAFYDGTASLAETKPEKYELDGVCCAKDESEQASLKAEIGTIIKLTDTSMPKFFAEKRTLLMLDDDMIRHKCSSSHPERPARYTEIKKHLQELGLYERCTLGKSRKATEEELNLVHSRDYIDTMKKTRNMNVKELLELGSSMNSIYINQSTYDCALIAVGCALEAVDKIMDCTYTNAFALIRPPGHHANRDTAAGFCFFNNVVIAAKYALKKYKDVCKRVLIVDYDFHHGDGVQDLVQGEDSILYISLHGYNDAYEYPMKRESNFMTGHKNIINIPWNDDKMGDTEYLLAYMSVVLPCAYEFNPDLVLVSSGFDAAIHDLLGSYKVTPPAFGHLIHHLQTLASGKLIACLEGGYNLESIAESAAHVVSVLLGDPPQSLKLRAPSEAAIISIKNVISYHKSNYKLLSLDCDIPSDKLD